MNTLIILPSYNEKDNLNRLVEALLATDPSYAVCVVDDNSPDGTAEELRTFLSRVAPEAQARVHLIVRHKKDGRGGAVREGLIWGLAQHNPPFAAFVEMDCDFSHRPDDVPRGLAMLANHDVVLGSRYPDGEIHGWPLRRRVFSRLANLVARAAISPKVADYTNGFRFYSRRAAELMAQAPQQHKGYIYLSETVACFLRHGLALGSFPIVFANRERGSSNTNLAEVASALAGICSIAWRHRFR